MKKLKGNLYKPGESAATYTGDSFESLTPGAYICKVSQVKDDPDKEYLYLEYDIAEGEHAGYYERLSDRAGFWGGRVWLSYKDKAQSIFSRAIKAINVSNPNFIFNPFEDGKNADEKTLIGKTFAIVLHEEEYDKNDGSVGTRLSASATAIITLAQAKEGKFNKKLLEKVSRRQEQASSGDAEFLEISSENPFA